MVLGNKLTIIRGDSVTLPVTFKNSDGSAINLTGSTVFFTVKASDSDSDDNAKIKKSVTVHTSPTEGKTTIELSTTDTNLSAGIYLYDIQIVDSLGKVSSVRADKLEVIKDITLRII